MRSPALFIVLLFICVILLSVLHCLQAEKIDKIEDWIIKNSILSADEIAEFTVDSAVEYDKIIEYEDISSSPTLTIGYETTNEFVFYADNDSPEPALTIAPDGFWVRDVKVDDTPEGYQEFYEAFKAFLEGR